MKNYFAEKLKEAEVLGGGNTNKVYLTEDETVIKIFSRHSFDVLVMASSYLMLLGKFRYLSPEQRIENEIEARRLLETNLEIPEVIKSEGKFFEYKYLEGESLLKALSTSNAEMFGEKLGTAMKTSKSQGLALVDCKLNNFIVADEEICLIDLELSNSDPASIEHRISVWTMLMSAKTLDSELYQDFLKGFENQYGDVRNIVSNFIGTVLGLGLVTVIDFELVKVPNVLKNSFR